MDNQPSTTYKKYPAIYQAIAPVSSCQINFRKKPNEYNLQNTIRFIGDRISIRFLDSAHYHTKSTGI
jgi:hypothetical protein